MGVTISYYPEPKQKYIESSHSIRETLEETFGHFPLRLSIDNISTLRAMAKVYGAVLNNPYQQLLDAIEKHEEIRVEAGY